MWNVKLEFIHSLQWTQERVRNSRGKRVISVRATEDLLYFLLPLGIHTVARINQLTLYTVELQWLEHFRDYENMFETGVVRATEGLL